MLKIQAITPESFAPFGTVLDFSTHPEDPRFEVKSTESASGWRIAVFRVSIHEAARLECHPTSLESFTPYRGVGVLLCAEPDHPDEVSAFLLDCAVCLNKGVWHEVVALSEEAFYQITENLEVNSVFHTFPAPIRVAAAP